MLEKEVRVCLKKRDICLKKKGMCDRGVCYKVEVHVCVGKGEK